MPAILVAVIVIILPLFFPSAYYYRIGALVLIYALAVVGLNLLMGFAGQDAGLFAVGAAVRDLLGAMPRPVRSG